MKPFTQENFEKFVLYRSSLQQSKNYERMIIAIKNKYELSEEREDIVRGHMNENPFKVPK
jgi:hypothetical protein